MNAANHLRLQQTPAHQAQYSSLPLQMPTANYIESPQSNVISECGPQRMAEQMAAIPVQEAAVINANACNYRNCSISGSLNSQKSSRRADVVFQTPQHSRVRRNYDKEAERSVSLTRNQSSNAILPPPLFDESAMNVSTLPLLPNDSIRQLKSRRHHRTIPRHFTVAASLEPQPVAAKAPVKHNSDDDLNRSSSFGGAPSAGSKKSVCQCPVQHVPMTYMGSNHLNMTRAQPNDALLSTLSRKSSHQRSNVAKSASFNSAPPSAAGSSAVQSYHRNSASGLLSAATAAPPAPVTTKKTVTPSQVSAQSGNLHRQKAAPKIQTISKQIGNNEFGCHRSPTAQSLDLKGSAGGPLSQSKSDLSDEIKPAPILNSNEMYASPFPIQLIESMGKSQSKDLDNPSGTNPVLPPKMCKLSTGSASSSRIQTISKPTPSAMSYTQPPEQPKRREHRDRTKSPVREKTLPLSAAIDGRHLGLNQGKTNYPPPHLSMSSNHFTLPKFAGNSKSSLSEILNKVPNSVTVPEESFPRGSKTGTGKTPSHERKRDSSDGKLLTSICMDYQALTSTSAHKSGIAAKEDKQLPVCTTYTNCSNPKEHFLPNDTSLDDDYLSECENCKSAHGSRYFLDEEIEEQPQETMTLQRKMDEKEDEQTYYRTSSTLPTNTKQKTT